MRFDIKFGKWLLGLPKSQSRTKWETNPKERVQYPSSGAAHCFVGLGVKKFTSAS